MEPLIYQDLPDLSTGVLVDMAGWPALREARKLYDAGAVKSVEWKKPYLTAELAVGPMKFALRLALRSTAFAENSCNCDTGRKGFVCAHALAACLAAVHKKEEAEKAAKNPLAALDARRAEKEREKEHRPVVEKPTPTMLLSFNVDANGKPVECRFVLPPNLAASAPRNMIVIKLELIAEGKRIAPERIFKGGSYKLDAQTLKALYFVEAWNHGKLAGLLQIKREQLRALIATLAPLPAFEWAAAPNRAIAWDGGRLPGVSELVDEPAPRPGNNAVAPDNAPSLSDAKTPAAIAVRRSSGVVTEGRSARMLEARQIKLPLHRIAIPVREKEEEDRISHMTVDGSPHFLAIQTPSRDHPLYSRAHALLDENGFHLEPANSRWWLRDRHKVLNFLAEHGEELDRLFAPEYTDNYKTHMLAVKKAKIVANATHEKTGGFLLSLRVDAGPLGEEDIRRALASRQYYVVSGENIWLLPPTQLKRMAEAQSALSGLPGQPLVPKINRRLSNAQICDADDILNGLADEIETPQQWKGRISALKNISKLQAPPVSKELDATLRGYQKIGAAWLWHLFKCDLGGVLADEMGLGKTIQAVALLTAVKSRGEANPSLVVCPAGLVENWMRECTKFGPELVIKRHHGAVRLVSAADMSGCDVVITSYQTLVRDSELFSPVPFATIIADEAQHIKNRRTQAAAALRSLRAKSRFVLTGTPVENSLDDLRSIFAFILPGYLARVPDGSKKEERSWFDDRHLKQAVPYILRRSKKLVAPELPDKIEQTVYCELSPAQLAVYNELKEQGQKAMFEMEMSGVSENKLRFEAFTRLLRLRQTCVDPRLVRPAMDAADSAKLRALEEILNEAIDGGHRLLVFSQFVEALKLIAAMLKEKELPYAYIDGSTPNRQKECDRFNEDDSIPVFLISLKAGGTGLNLTGADMVIHYDPWWNPAVEAQATDRAHRIGQTRTVTSLKLIATGTVEEKVLELQKTKALILAELLDESAAATSKISLADLRGLMG
jgi:superfamily II DNA or RNA helicase